MYLENYIRTVLYAYPYLETVGEDYAQHIKNKALLSYDSRMDAERLAEYLAEEILHKESLEWLRNVLEEMLARLDRLERKILGIRFFGERYDEKILNEEYGFKALSVRKRLRYKEKLYEKVAEMLRVEGLTKRTFEEELSPIEIIRKIHERVLKKEKKEGA